MTAISQGGAAQRVKVITAADLKANGGSYALEGRPPLAVYGVLEAETKAQGGQFAVEGNIAQPVYIVESPDGTVTGNVPVPMIAVEGGLAVGNVAIPVYVVGGSLGGLDPVTNLALTIGNAPANDEIDATWDAVSGAMGYEIEYSDDGVAWTPVDTTAGTTYSLTSADYDVDAVTHYVRVRAVNGGGESEWEQATISGLLVELVAYWTMNEDSGNPRESSVGTDDMTEIDPPVSAAAGKIGNAVSLSGAGTKCLWLASPSFTLSGDFSLASWLKPAVITDSHHILDRRQSTSSWTLLQEATTFRWYGASSVASPATISAGTYYHVYMDYQASGTLSGISVNNETLVTANSAQTNGAGPITFGAFRGDDGAGAPNVLYIGDIDETGIWNRRLSVAQRTYLFNSGNGRTYPFNV